ncbi:MAG: hypothetical protein K2Q25_07800 [Mycobacteriaceae bacterium]|nr:hypothetical protein [Mycobacteriaceae bacterium]
MYDIKTDHNLVARGFDVMELVDQAGTPIVTGTRTGSGSWLIHADGVPDMRTSHRANAINAMIDHALAALGGTGYSTLVPHELAALP